MECFFHRTHRTKKSPTARTLSFGSTLNKECCHLKKQEQQEQQYHRLNH
jgi:hypothetical protein